MGGIVYRNEDEQEHSAQVIARTTRGWWNLPGAKTWKVMEACLMDIAWVDRLRTLGCALLWGPVEGLSDLNSSK